MVPFSSGNFLTVELNVPDKLPHVEDVYSVFQSFQRACLLVQQNYSPAQVGYNAGMKAAQDMFKVQMDKLGLRLDYTKRA